MPVINKKPKPTKQDIIDGLKLMKKVYPMPSVYYLLKGKKNAHNK